MSDAKLRARERRTVCDGAEAEVRYLNALARTGKVNQVQLSLAAYGGDTAAITLLALPRARIPFQDWLLGLGHWGRSVPALVAAAAAWFVNGSATEPADRIRAEVSQEFFAATDRSAANVAIGRANVLASGQELPPDPFALLARILFARVAGEGAEVAASRALLAAIFAISASSREDATEAARRAAALADWSIDLAGAAEFALPEPPYLERRLRELVVTIAFSPDYQWAREP
jgi:hypothetical protein